MNTIITSKKAILDTCRRLVKEQGWPAVSIRNVAAACGVSVGSIYYYFDSKTALTTAAVESIWQDIFHFDEPQTHFGCFTDCVHWVFECLKKGSVQYPGFFTSHSMNLIGEAQAGGKQLMAQSWEHMREQLYAVLMQDQKIRTDTFNQILTPRKFVDLIFSLILASLIRQDYEDSTILEMAGRILYGSAKQPKQQNTLSIHEIYETHD